MRSASPTRQGPTSSPRKSSCPNSFMERVIEVDERVMADGKAVRGPDLEALEPETRQGPRRRHRFRRRGADACLAESDP